jgi:diguanylate cyclase (GGDEF)-like protein
MRRLRRAAAVLVATLAFAGAAGAAQRSDFNELVDALVRQGDENPSDAIASLNELGSLDRGATPVRHRLTLLSMGIVAARNGRDAEAMQQIDALLALKSPVDGLAEADAHVIRAELEDNAGHRESAYEHARAALRGYGALCKPGPGRRDDCDYRSWWRALLLAQVGASGQGNLVVAASHNQAMLDIARRAADRPREAIALAYAGLQAEANADSAGANRLMAQAQRLGRVDGSAWLEVRLAVVLGMLHHVRHEPEQVQRDYEAALAVANAAGLRRPAMHLRANLSDTYIREGRPAEALAAIALALPVAREHHDLRIERLLLHNATLAHLALGRLTEAKGELPHVLELWKRDTGPGQRAEALREFGDALAKAGDISGALALFHQEEALATEIRAANKSAAEAEVRAKYDQESQKRRIELMARDNQLKSAQLDNRTLTRRLWMFAGVAIVLLAVLAVLMYRRMRELNRTLVRHEALLRAHSERDALTGLANRRQFREVMRVRGGDKAFRGALLMVDVDHFKRINDHYGHAAGDRVLVEVARRLGAAVRAADLVARWGGEEFLVFAPNVDGAELDQLAERVRLSMNEASIALDKGSIDVTVSIGYAAFPLPASHLPVTWEQAVNLADLSLYTAKNHGRNCAVGIVRTTAGSADALREVEADLAQARQDGRITLKVSPQTPAAAERPPTVAA